MIHLEEMIDCLAGEGKWLFATTNIHLSSKDAPLVASIANQVNYLSKPLTQKQANVMVGICRKYRQHLEIAFGQDLSKELAAPTLKFGIRQLVTSSKKIEIDPETRKIIKIFFPFNEKTITAIKSLAKNRPFDSGKWSQDEKCWQLPVTESNILFVNKEIIDHEFEVCDIFKEYTESISEIMDNFEDHIPQLVKREGKYEIINAHSSIPQANSNDLLEVLFHCKKYCISVKSEDVYSDIKTLNLNEVTEKFIDSTSLEAQIVDSSTVPIEFFDDIIKYSGPTLLVIPIGQEFQQLKKWSNYLLSRGIQKDEISVMFRTDNSTDKSFNELVRSFGLNNPVTESTKVVVISVKLPKPVVKSNIQFETVINLNQRGGAHYSLSSYLQDYPGIIYYNQKTSKLTNV